MATPDDAAFERDFGGYKPAATSVPVRTIRPIIGGETPEAAAARRADEERKQSGEQRDVTAAQLAQEAADRAARGETRDIASKEFSQIGSLRTEFLGIPEVKEFRQVQNATRQIIDLTSKGTPIGNIGSVFSLMKILDPGSTVREGEAASVQNAAGVPDRFRNAYNQLLSGEGLSQSQRNDMADVARSIYNQRLTGYNALAETYRGLMIEQRADPDKQGITLATPYEIKAATGGAGPAVAATQPGVPQIEVAKGTSFSTEADFKRQKDSAEAWAATQGMPFDQALAQFNAAMQAKGYGPAGKETIDVLQWYETNKPNDRGAAQWELPSTGVREGGAPGRLEAVGSALVTGYTGGLAEEAVNLFSPEAAAKLEAAKQYGREEYPGTTLAGEIVGGLVSPINKIIPGAPAAAPMKEAVIQTAKQGALYGGVSGFGEAAPDAGIVERIPGAVFGATIGGGAGAAGARYVTPAVTSVVENYVAPAVSKLISPAAVQAIPAAEQAGIPVLTSDVIKPRTWFGRWAQETMEKVPILGTGGARAVQREAREAAITKLYDDVRAGTAEIDDITKDFLRVRGNQIGNLVQQKQEVFGNLTGNNIDANAAIAAIDKGIARYQNTAGYETLIDNLMRWRSNLVKGDINVIEDTRKLIGDAGFDQTLAPVKSALNSVVNDLYPALNQDMGAAIQKFGKAGDFSKWKAANEALSDFATNLENSTVKRVLAKGTASPEEAASLLFSKKPSEVRALFGSLSEEGKKNARALIVQRMVEKAGGLDELSPAKFTRQLKDSARTIGVAFDAPEAARLTGLLRALQFTRRADQAAVTTPTGQALIPLFAGSAAGGYFAPGATGAAGAVLSTIMAGARIYETKAVKNLLVALSRTAPGSRAEQNVLGSLARAMSQEAGREGGEAGRTVQEEMAPPKAPVQ
jgi:hypothetical protein